MSNETTKIETCYKCGKQTGSGFFEYSACDECLAEVVEDAQSDPEVREALGNLARKADAILELVRAESAAEIARLRQELEQAQNEASRARMDERRIVLEEVKKEHDYLTREVESYKREHADNCHSIASVARERDRIKAERDALAAKLERLPLLLDKHAKKQRAECVKAYQLDIDDDVFGYVKFIRNAPMPDAAVSIAEWEAATPPTLSRTEEAEETFRRR